MAQDDNTSKTLRIKNWSRFQHFKDRKPPWVKLYRDLLDDIEWANLDPAAAKLLVMLWLIAAEDDGNLPDIAELAFRLRLPGQRVITLISKLQHWLDHFDISVISGQYQKWGVEKETQVETQVETQKEAEGEAEGAIAPISILLTILSSEQAKAVIEHRRSLRCPLTKRSSELLVRELGKWPDPNEAADAMIANGWRGFKVEWLENAGRRNGREAPRSAKERVAEKVREAGLKNVQQAIEREKTK
jgi:hypothetical protein